MHQHAHNRRGHITSIVIAVVLVIAVAIGAAYCAWFHNLNDRMPWTRVYHTDVLITVTDHSGKPISGCDVMVTPQRHEPRSSVREYTYTNTDGTARIDGVSSGQVNVTVSCLQRTADRQCDAGYDSCLSADSLTQANNRAATVDGDVTNHTSPVIIGGESPQTVTVPLGEWSDESIRPR